jgi:hypothetical protein
MGPLWRSACRPAAPPARTVIAQRVHLAATSVHQAQFRLNPPLDEPILREVDAWEAVEELDRRGWTDAGLEVPAALDPARRRPAIVGLACWLLLSMAVLQGVAAVSLVSALGGANTGSTLVILAAGFFATAVGCVICSTQLARGRHWARAGGGVLAALAVAAVTLQPWQGHGLAVLSTAAWLVAGLCLVHPKTTRFCLQCSGGPGVEMAVAA